MVFQTQVLISLVILVIDIQDLYVSKYMYTINKAMTCTSFLSGPLICHQPMWVADICYCINIMIMLVLADLQFSNFEHYLGMHAI